MRVRFGDVILDSDARTLVRRGENVALSGKALQLLELLLASRPRALTKQEILDAVWPDTFVSEANLATLVREIRAAIGDDAREPRFIRTLHRHGYAFIGEATALDEDTRVIESVAVLRFENATGDPQLEFLAEGIAESLINSLAALPRLRVLPRSAAFAYDAGDLRRVRNELRVDAAITGRLRRAGPDITLQVELNDLARHDQLWGGQLVVRPDDAFRLSETLFHEIASRLGAAPAQAPKKRHVPDDEAYQLYLHGRHHWNRRTREGVERAIDYFERSAKADPNFALAYSGLADSYLVLASRDLVAPAELFPKAEEAAHRALQLDPDLAEAHASIGAINEVFRWDWRAAENAFVRALTLSPNYSTARQWYALALAHRGRFSEAFGQLQVARENDPLSVLVNANIALVHYLARDFAAADRFAVKALDINPYHEQAHFIRGVAFEAQGRRDDADAELRRADEISRGEPHVVAARGHLAATGGNLESAHEFMQRLTDLAASRHVSPVHFATIEVASKRDDDALASLERALVLRSGWLVYLGTEPRFDPLRAEPRFVAVVRRVLG